MNSRLNSPISRRAVIRGLAAGVAGAAAAGPLWTRFVRAAPAKQTITRIRYYETLTALKPMINQSMHIVTVETDGGLMGIGEGGSKELIEQCAKLIIGQDPARIESLWQLMYRGLFYPAGREKLHAIGAIDLALWDIKGKALGAPVYDCLLYTSPSPRD